HARQRALAGAVRAHDRVHLTGSDLQVQAAQDLLPLDRGVQVLDGQHQPTAPSRLTFSSACASTANSMGNIRNTSRQKPFTIIETASSSAIPRWRQYNNCSAPIFDVDASCSTWPVGFFTSMYGKVCAPHSLPISSESHWVKLRAPVAE